MFSKFSFSLFIAAILASLSLHASASPNLTGDYQFVSWSCDSSEVYMNGSRWFSISDGMEFIASFNDCPRGRDCEGRLPSRGFTLKNVTRTENSAYGIGNDIAYDSDQKKFVPVRQEFWIQSETDIKEIKLKTTMTIYYLQKYQATCEGVLEKF